MDAKGVNRAGSSAVSRFSNSDESSSRVYHVVEKNHGASLHISNDARGLIACYVPVIHDREIGMHLLCKFTRPLHSPRIERVQVMKSGHVRRSKLYYLRSLTGKAARLREKRTVTA